MKEKKKARKPSVTRSELHMMGLDAPVMLRESYSTVRRRIYDGLQFMEVTSANGRKLTINKGIVRVIYPVV